MVLLMLTYSNLKQTPYRFIQYTLQMIFWIEEVGKIQMCWISVFFASGGLEPGWQSSFTPGLLAPARNQPASPTTHLVIVSFFKQLLKSAESLLRKSSFPPKRRCAAFPHFQWPVRECKSLAEWSPNQTWIWLCFSVLTWNCRKSLKGWLGVRS